MKDTTDFIELLWKLITDLGYSFFAGLGGMIFYLLGILETEDSKSVRWHMVIIYGLASAFVGQIVFYVCRYLQLDPDLMGSVIGLSGAIGARASINFMNLLLKNKFGVGFYSRRNDDESNDGSK